jgi:hypothetical protein
LVPNQDPEKIGQLVTNYINSEFEKLNSPNKLSVVMPNAGKPWVADPTDPNFTAGKKAMKSGKTFRFNSFLFSSHCLHFRLNANFFN